MLSNSDLQKLYRDMVKIKFVEETLIKPINDKLFKCPVHLYSGQEAVAVGVCAALTTNDYVFSTHRSHGHYLAKGGDLKAMLAEIYGKEAGCSRGRGGSMHLYAPEVGFCGSAPIVAGTISLALGGALASSIRNDNRVTVCFFGDGAVGEGVLYESLNFAALKKLPVIFACENNLYSTHLPIRECRISEDVYRIAEPFGIRTSKIDGNDVLSVYISAQKAVEACRYGDGPEFIEFKTYRMRGHVGPDDNIQGTHTDIRPRSEVENWSREDPVSKFKRYLIKNSIFQTFELNEIDAEIEQEIHEAHTYAQNNPFPTKSDLKKYVFKQ